MRILIVDDEYVSRMKLKLLLSAHGETETSTSGEKAFKMFEKAHLEEKPFDLITMDINMPGGMSGQEVVNKIRTWEKDNDIDVNSGVKILMITVKDSSEDILSSFHEGCTSYLIKPVTRAKLQKAIENLWPDALNS